VTICCISDTHGKQGELDLSKYTADALIHAGDFMQRGTKTEAILLLEWLEAQNFKYKILISGNHSGIIADDPKWFTHALSQFPSITYLNDSGVVIEGYNFYGSPYSNQFGNWSFMAEETELTKVWDKIPDDTNILITHGPAYGCLDLVEKAYGKDPHVGSKSLCARKLAIQDSLLLHVCGHIHCAYGATTTSCKNVNASVLNDSYKLVNKPIVVEI